MEAKTAAILTLCVSAGVGLLLLLIICALSMNWWPMLSFLVFALLPISVFFTSIQSENEDINLWEHFGFCTGGFVLSSFFGLPLIFAHVGSLNVLNRTTMNLTDELDVTVLAGWSVANVILFAGILGFSFIAKSHDD